MYQQDKSLNQTIGGVVLYSIVVLHHWKEKIQYNIQKMVINQVPEKSVLLLLLRGNQILVPSWILVQVPVTKEKQRPLQINV